jgi:hypothetical protein
VFAECLHTEDDVVLDGNADFSSKLARQDLGEERHAADEEA